MTKNVPKRRDIGFGVHVTEGVDGVFVHFIRWLQHSIQGLWLRATPAGFAPACHQTISSTHVHRFVRQFGQQVLYADEPPKKAHGLRLVGGGYAMIRFDEISAITSGDLDKYESIVHVPGGALTVLARFEDLCSYVFAVDGARFRDCYSNHPPEENTSSRESPEVDACSMA